MSEIESHGTVGIESVEWLDAGAGNLSVRVTGRWRRRRGWLGSSGTRTPAVLVIEAEGQRHRFPAMPEPPSLAGAAPGTWRLTFTVPGALAPRLSGLVWLTLGTVTVPLTVPESLPVLAAEPPPPAPARGEAGITPAEAAPPLEIERAWRRADEAERTSAGLLERIASLEQERDAERAEREATVQEHERRRTSAEQRARAEETLRHDLTRRLAEGAEEAQRARRAADELAVAQERIRDLETSLAARRSMPSAVAGTAHRPPPAEAERLRSEDLLRRRRSVGTRVPAEPPAVPDSVSARRTSWATAGSLPGMTSGPGVGDGELVRALRSELGARACATAGLRARLVQAETQLAARVLLEQRTTATLRDLRGELERLREALDAEVGRRRAAEAEIDRMRSEVGGGSARTRDFYDAIGEIRGALEGIRDPEPPASVPAAGGPAEPATADSAATSASETVSPERLSDALARLRESREPLETPEPREQREPAPAVGSRPVAVDLGARPAGAPTIEPALRRLAARDATAAGRLLLDLVGAQRAAYPYPVAYDLVLGPGHGCVQVTVGPDTTTIELSGAARVRGQVNFQVLGDPARLARLLLAGRLRRLWRVGIARVRGPRDGLVALRSLLTLPLDLDGLYAAGLRARSETLLGLVAAMTQADWTRGERFTLAVEDPTGTIAYLEIRDGRPPLAGGLAPEGRIAVTLTGSADDLAATLAGRPGGAQVAGDEGALAAVRGWIARAQSG